MDPVVAVDVGHVVRETLRDLKATESSRGKVEDTSSGGGSMSMSMKKKKTKKKSSGPSAFDRIQRLLSTCVDVRAVDDIYGHVLVSATEILSEEYEALGQSVDLLKRALLRYLPSLKQLERINEWCELTVSQIRSNAKSEDEEKEAQRIPLVNSLKFLKRLVGRHIDTWKEEQSLSERKKGDVQEDSATSADNDHADVGDEDGEIEEEDLGERSGLCYPYSALSQLQANAEPARRRTSSQHRKSSQADSSKPSVAFNNGSSDAFSRPESEQNRFFNDLLEDRVKTIEELGDNVKLVLAYMMEMYEKDPQQTFVIVSIFLQEMLMENSVTIQKRAFDIFLNLVYSWQNSVALSLVHAAGAAKTKKSDAKDADREQEETSQAYILNDALWHVSLLNEMCLVLLECGREVDSSVWRSAHACLLFCCAKGGLLIPKLVKVVSFDILKKLLEVASDQAWGQGTEGTIISMMTSHILPHRGNHLGIDSYSLQMLGGEFAIIGLMKKLGSLTGLANLFVVLFFIVLHELNGPAITLSGEHMMNSHTELLDHFLHIGLPLRLSKCLKSDRPHQKLSELGSQLMTETPDSLSANKAAVIKKIVSRASTVS